MTPFSSAPASSPCAAGSWGGEAPFTGDPADWRAVVHWRHGERRRLHAGRQALSADGRDRITRAIIGHLDALLASVDLAGRVIAGYWPIRGEPDLRRWFQDQRRRGAILSLPVCDTPPQPMTFRRWQPDQDLQRGQLGILVPPPSAGTVTPDLVIAPLLGWDPQGHRLGLGAGYFDRTLATADPRPFCIGAGLQSARLSSIHPQPHDIPLHLIVTEAGLVAGHAGRLHADGSLPARRG